MICIAIVIAHNAKLNSVLDQDVGARDRILVGMTEYGAVVQWLGHWLVTSGMGVRFPSVPPNEYN